MNYFFAVYQLAELETGKDVQILLKEGNFLEEDLNRRTFKKILQAIGRNDLATKLETYIEAG